MLQTAHRLAFALAATLSLTAPSLGYEQDFSAMTAEDFAPVTGQAHEGSTIDLTEGPDRALRLSYHFGGRGHVGIGWKQRPALNVEGDQLAVQLRVRGAGREHFTKAHIRFMDANGEFLQYPLLPMVQALNGEGWREVRGRVDLRAFTSAWGGGEEGRKELDLPVRFHGLAFDYRGQHAAEGEVLFDDLVISGVRAGESGPQLEVTSDRRLPIVEPGQPVEFKVEASLKDPAERAAGAVQWRVIDFDGVEVAAGREAIAWGGDRAEPATVRFQAAQPGIYYVDFDLVDSGGAILSQSQTRVAAFRAHERPVASEPFIFGVGGHPARTPNEEALTEIEWARAIGFSAFRFDFTWSRMEPEAGQYVWEQYDFLVDAFAANGIVPQAVVGFSPRWASTKGDASHWREWTMAPPRIEAYTDFLRQAVERYGDRVKHWEIWNEPDITGFWLGTVEQYVELFNASARAIHETDPTAKVMNGGFSETKRQPNFIPRFLEMADPKPDIIAFHSHNAFRDFVQTGIDIERYLGNAGLSGTPVWMNEAGATNHSGTTERAQAILAAKRLAYAPSLGHEAYLWYDMRNDGDDPNQDEYNYGLVLRDFSPKASAVVAHHVITQLAGKRFVRRFDLGSDLFALLYTDGERSVLVAWNERTSAGDQPRLFRTNAQRVRTMTIMGVEADTGVTDGVFAVSFRQEPHFVLLDGPDVELVGNVVEVTPTRRLAPGSQETVSIDVVNPFGRPFAGELSLTAAGGWTVTPDVTRVNVPAGGRQTVTATLRAPQSAVSSLMRLELRTDALTQPLGASVSLEPAIVAPRTTWAEAQAGVASWAGPQAKLVERSNIVSLFQATPMKELHFRGVEDMSAEVFIGHDEGGIVLVVRARDDAHVQRETVGEMWKGDSLQLAIAAPTGEFYEWTAGLTESGPRVMLHHGPPSVKRGEQQMDVAASREGDVTTYALRIPRDLPGIAAALEQGCGLNVLVNDNDGAGRKGWIEWTPGIGQAKDPSQYPAIVFER